MHTLTILSLITVIIILAVAFVNGMTDAPNAIVSCVSTKSISLKKAVLIAAISDFAGSLTFGVLNGNVAKTVKDIAFFGSDNKTSLIGLSAAVFSVVVWAVAAWRFGIPTSESHALISSLAGAGLAVNGSFAQTDFSAWSKVFIGLFVSVILGFFAGYVITKITLIFFKTEKSDNFFAKSQIASSALMSFMHGAQDSQKFSGLMMLALSASGFFIGKDMPLWIMVLCPIFISIGTAAGGERIIKAVGTDMLKMENEQGFSSDIAGAICLLVSTIMGMPVSTTHTKISAVMGAGVAKNFKLINWKIAFEMIAAWLITFPAGGILGWFFTRVFLCIF